MEKIKLSASKIKTLKDCSWIYWCKYHLKLPDIANDGASRGSCVHYVLDPLLKEKHRKHVDCILGSNTIPKSVEKLALIHAKKLNVNDIENFNMIKEMIIVAVQYDFLCSGAQKITSEKEFTIETEKFIIRGFIDKTAEYEDGRTVIWDYKTSKSKFDKKEIKYNIQSFIYSLACLKLLGRIPEIKFLFLRYPKQPVQEADKLTKKQLAGFEIFLESVANYLSKFDRNMALKDLAYFKVETKWLCGKEGNKKDGTPNFICQYRNPFSFYGLVDENNKVIKSAMKEEELKPKENQKIKKLYYKGCPVFNRNRLSRNFSLT
ncbi:MAG: PD-(D/E)XK nuclease family protein [Nanoarchaeota archaeon]